MRCSTFGQHLSLVGDWPLLRFTRLSIAEALVTKKKKVDNMDSKKKIVDPINKNEIMMRPAGNGITKPSGLLSLKSDLFSPPSTEIVVVSDEEPVTSKTSSKANSTAKRSTVRRNESVTKDISKVSKATGSTAAKKVTSTCTGNTTSRKSVSNDVFAVDETLLVSNSTLPSVSKSTQKTKLSKSLIKIKTQPSLDKTSSIKLDGPMEE